MLLAGASSFDGLRMTLVVVGVDRLVLRVPQDGSWALLGGVTFGGGSIFLFTRVWWDGLFR